MMESLCGRHDDALATLGGCFDHAKGRLHKTEVRRLKMNVEILKNDLPAALEEGPRPCGRSTSICRPTPTTTCSPPSSSGRSPSSATVPSPPSSTCPP
ncbi:hypothetical protein [Nannocystis pusilla]|uniref:hypothetical protein n=1 Tax=Nannocystis pusilla TaxID=889268 RepID=UPI003B82807D